MNSPRWAMVIAIAVVVETMFLVAYIVIKLVP